MEITEHITAVGREVKLLAEAARQGDLETAVPSCPAWNMRALLSDLSTRMAPRYRGFPETRTMAVHATDTGDHWHLTIAPDELRTVRGDELADATLSGSASDLYLAVWNRGDDSNMSLTGDRDVLKQWRGDKQSRWAGEERQT